MAQLKDLIVQGESTFLNDVNVQSALSAKALASKDNNTNITTVLIPQGGGVYFGSPTTNSEVSLIITPPEIAFNNLNFTLEIQSSSSYSMYKIFITAEPKGNNQTGYNFSAHTTAFKSYSGGLNTISIYSNSADTNYGKIVLNNNGSNTMWINQYQIIIKDIYCNISDNQSYNTFMNTSWDITLAPISTLSSMTALPCYNTYYEIN